jgi:tetraprenyl-beta-curcumene synthase
MSRDRPRAGQTLLLANLRYWTTVAPLVRGELARWEERAREIPDPFRRELATAKLREERFNVRVAATLATLAPRAYRPPAVEAIVALQVAYDYLDLLAEQQPGTPTDAGTRPLDTLVDTFRPGPPHDGEHEAGPPPQDGDRYARELAVAARIALSKLPATGAIAAVALACAERCAEAQRASHATASEREAWALRESAGSGLRWPEYLAATAASVLCLHALVAAAADPHTTSADASAIDAAYLSICALTMLDSLVDRHHDLATGELNYVDLYGSAASMIARLALLARDAAAKARSLPHGAHHLLTLAGIVAYYTSALTPNGAYPPSITKPIRDELRPLMTPTLAVMRAWRGIERTLAFAL